MASRIIFVLFLVAGLSNCVAIQSFPGAARAGDTITISVGSVDGLNKNNITVEFYPDSDPLNPVDITSNIRSTLKIYPDKTSKAYLDESAGFGLETMTFLSQLSLHGPWQNIVVLDLPTSLPVGTGVIRVQFDPEVVPPLTTANANDVDITMEILPALGTSHSFEYRKLAANNATNLGDLTMLEPNRQVLVRYPAGTAGPPEFVSAAEYTITVSVVDQISTDVTNLLNDNDFAVVLDDQPSYIRNQLSLLWSRQDGQFKVLVLSPKGTQDVNQIRFSVLFSDLLLSENNGWMLSDNATLDSIKYFDTDGQEVTRPLPELVIQ